MGAESINIFNLFLLMLLVLPILIINKIIGIKRNKSIITSILRMILQLTLVGFYLQYIFNLNNAFVNVLYILIMICVATFSIVGSTPLKIKHVFFPLFLSLLVPDFLMLLFFNGVVIRIDQLFEAKYMITIGGMILGNGLSGNIVGLSTFYKSILKNEEAYRYDLMLGANHYQALKPYYIDALLVSINPTIASMATIGLVSLPGMMTGQILGGSIPMEAIRYQIAIMIGIFVTKYFNISLAIYFTTKSMFTKKLQLNHDNLKV